MPLPFQFFKLVSITFCCLFYLCSTNTYTVKTLPIQILIVVKLCLCIYTLLVTRPEITALIYIKYTCSYCGIYLLLCMCYLQTAGFIEFFMDFCIYDDILDAILITDKKLLQFKLSKLINFYM